jgi:anti-sigma factor ChrR (cupin superfamily)
MIACWFHKKVIARCLDTSEALPDSTQRHVQNCPACRHFLDLERALVRRLAADAERHSQSPSPFLHARIMASLDRTSQIAEPERRFLNPIWATALVIVGLGLFSIPFLRNSKNPAHPNRIAASSNLLAATQQLASNSPKTTARNLLEWSKALDQPLETEIKSVVSDAKTAMNLLAQNFLLEK